MGLSYSLDLAADCEAAHINDLLLRLSEVRLDDQGRLTADGVDYITLKKLQVDEENARDSIDEIGFLPNFHLHFPLNKFAHDEAGLIGQVATLKIAVSLLHGLPADAALVFNGEILVFRRIQGRLILNECAYWDEARIHCITLPYQLESSSRG